VTKRVSPIERIRAENDELFAVSERPLTEVLVLTITQFPSWGWETIR
jgi:hypothetical protein